MKDLKYHVCHQRVWHIYYSNDCYICEQSAKMWQELMQEQETEILTKYLKEKNKERK